MAQFDTRRRRRPQRSVATGPTMGWSTSAGGHITIKGKSFEALALPHPLSFPPPLAELASDPEGFAFWWQLIQFVFELPTPSTFPALPSPVTADERERLERYRSAAAELATSTLLSHRAEVSVRATNDGQGGQPEEVRADFASNEVTRGFAALFRQFYSTDELASFQAVHRILWLASEAASDPERDERLAQLRHWGRAQRQLRGRTAKVLVGQHLREQGKWPGPIPGEDGASPEFLISAYNYGELLHWGDRRKTVATWGVDPFEGPWRRMQFLDAIGGLAHLYLGFSLVVHAALGQPHASDTAVETASD